MSKLNEEECSKYADTECKYGFVKNEYLTKLYDKISFVYWMNDEHVFAIMKNGEELEIKRSKIEK